LYDSASSPLVFFSIVSLYVLHLRHSLCSFVSLCIILRLCSSPLSLFAFFSPFVFFFVSLYYSSSSLIVFFSFLVISSQSLSFAVLFISPLS
jgi:hypothetical protein